MKAERYGFIFAFLNVCLALSIRYRARVAYDGSGFQGFQLQGGTQKRTVQGQLEEVFSRRLNQPVRVVGAGRTDAGVHSRGQVIHFDVEGELDDIEQLQFSLNRMMPDDLTLWDLQKAPEIMVKEIDGEELQFSWNAIFDNSRKLYSYRISSAPVMHPMERYYRWHPDRVNHWFNVTEFREIMQLYVGTHDFRAFANAVDRIAKDKGKALDTRRTVYSIDVVDESDGNYRIDIILKGALYKQVRNMVGTAMDVCRGRLSLNEFHRLIKGQGVTRDDNLSKPAPPHGLTLEYVYLDSESTKI